MIRFIIFLFVFVVLTLLTQIGGLVLLLAWLLTRFMRKIPLIVVFIPLYILATFFIVPPLAQFGGRVPLACHASDAHYAAGNKLYCWFNRNYVNEETQNVLEQLSRHMNEAFPQTTTLYLDGGFPFFDGFPLIPHLSHKDGRKLDIAFYYQDNQGQYLEGTMRSFLGYFAFEQPEILSKFYCPPDNILTMRWDFDFLQPLWPHYPLETLRTREAIRWLSHEGQGLGVEKVFVEPHLKEQLHISNDVIRFQGCRAARHDDHIHFQTRSL